MSWCLFDIMFLVVDEVIIKIDTCSRTWQRTKDLLIISSFALSALSVAIIIIGVAVFHSKSVTSIEL